MIRTQISMTEDQAEALRRLAALRRVSQAALLRDALDQLLGNEIRLRRIERARAVCGAFRSDLGAASGVDHDDLLDDAYAS